MSDILTKDEFFNAALNHIGSYPALAERVAVGDVFVTQHIGAIAQMLAMLSMQIGLGETEAWTKARDSMVLADAAARQIFPYGTAARCNFTVENNGTAAVTINAGRRLLDSRNRVWTVTDGAVINAGRSGDISAMQYNSTQFTHEVSELKSFYQIPIPEPLSDQYLLEVIVRHNDGSLFKHIERFNNVTNGDKVYHLFGDEIMNLYITFGLIDKFGYVPDVGEKFNIELRYTSGDITLKTDSELSFEYVQPNDENVAIFVKDMIQQGADAPNISELREVTRYPSIYDENAVYLGEFQALIERKHNPFMFLSVWNELAEEKARGQSVQNINKLFVSFVKSGVTAAAMQSQIRNTIQMADDSYQVVFVPAIERVIAVTVNMQLKSMYDEADVRQQIVLWLLNQYGRNSLWAKRGGQRINNRNTVRELTQSIPQFADGGSDLSMTFTQPSVILPELFQYVTAASITINNTPI